MTWISILGLVLSAVAIGVTVSIAVLGARARGAAARAAQRARVTDLLIGTMERAVRLNSQPAVVRLLRDPTLETALLVPRVLRELSREDEAVERWVLEQVARQLREPRRKQALQIQVEMTLTLLQWERGAIGTKWFIAHTHTTGPVSLASTTSVRRGRTRRLAGSLFVESFMATGVVVLAGKAWRLLD